MRLILFSLLLLMGANSSSLFSEIPEITRAQAKQIGDRIWKNECNGTINGLTSWNVGENFPSLGIAHFIWYPANEKKVFDESFPKLLQFLEDKQVILPLWLRSKPPCPWNTRDEFLKAVQDPTNTQMKELKELLIATIDLQALFCIERLKKSLPLMLAKAKPENQKKIQDHWDRLTPIPAGLFALIDYVNFKGEGIKETEQYNKQGWGLLQVLEEMKTQYNPLLDFSQSAQFVLTRRVQNSPPERNEKRWLPGWINRVKAYHDYRVEK